MALSEPMFIDKPLLALRPPPGLCSGFSRESTAAETHEDSSSSAECRSPPGSSDGRQGPWSPSMSSAGSPLPPGRVQEEKADWHVTRSHYHHQHVPRSLNLEEEYRSAQDSPPTTLMIRNIPNLYTQADLKTELEDLGLAGSFNFLYIPLDQGGRQRASRPRRSMSNVGYAFVNFVTPHWAEKCMALFQGHAFKRQGKASRKIASVSVAHIQGLEANLAHYKHAAVNRDKLKESRPVVVANLAQQVLAPEPCPPRRLPPAGCWGASASLDPHAFFMEQLWGLHREHPFKQAGSLSPGHWDSMQSTAA